MLGVKWRSRVGGNHGVVVHFFYDILLIRLCVEWWLPPPDMQMQLAGRNLCKLASSPAVRPVLLVCQGL